MNRYALMVLVPLSLLGACNRDNATDTTRTTGGTTPGTPTATTPATPGATTPTPGSDNTGVNARDRQGSGAVTPIDQGNSPADLEMTQKLRKDLVADDTLSVDAKNVKIITNDGVITLRGPVKNATERATIEAKVRRLAGSDRIIDEIEIETK